MRAYIKPLLNRSIAFLLFLILYVLFKSFRYRVLNKEIKLGSKNLGPYDNFILALWHENIVLGVPTEIYTNLAPIISASGDGDLATWVCQHFGMNPARGSSSRKGVNALKGVIKALKNGQSSAVTQDGPKGPRRKPKMGTIQISQLTGVPIVPIGMYSPKVYIFKKSWDQFKLPFPFAPIYIKYGEPFVVERNANQDQLNQYCQNLEESLNQLEVELRDYAEQES